MLSPADFLIWKYKDNDAPFNEIAYHQHQLHELYMIYSGEAKMFIGDDIITLRKGQMLVVSNTEPHYGMLTEAPYNEVSMQISTELLYKISENKILRALFLRYGKNRYYKIDTGEYFNEIKQLIENIFNEYYSNLPYKGETVCYLLGELLIKLYRLCPSAFPETDFPYNNMALEAQRYIDSHFNEQFSISELAERFFFSTSYFNFVFHQTTGYTPKQYIILCRLSEARALLISTKLSISDIAYKSGFADVNNFIRTFKSSMKMTPGQFRTEKKKPISY